MVARNIIRWLNRSKFFTARSALVLLCTGLLPMSAYSQTAAPIAAAFSPSNLGAGQSCSANPGGAPCSQQAAAIQSSSAPNSGAGNPINVVNGNKYQAESDMAALSGTLGLEWVRRYNSSFAADQYAPGTMGQGWHHSYDTRLIESPRFIQIIQADGSRLMFNKLSAVLCQGQSPQIGNLNKQGKEWVWQWTNGRELMFSITGRLVQIKDRTGPFVSLSYDHRDRLIKVVDPYERVLEINYANTTDKKIAQVVSPIGVFTYSYKDVNLVRARMPAAKGDKRNRSYHYENSQYISHLTGISDHTQRNSEAPAIQRASTYIYDEQGRGVLSTQGEPARLALDANGVPLTPKRLVPETGLGQVHLRFERIATPTQTGKTILTNSVGQETIYLHKIIGGQYRLISSLGPGCMHCGNTQQRFEYDSNGDVVETVQLDAQGRDLSAVKKDTDTFGRTTKIWQTKNSRLASKLQKREWIWTQRFEYNDPNNKFEPTLIARPSIMQGKEHQFTVSRNSYGQVIEVTESGYSPSSESLPITRTTSYRYQLINNRSSLVQIDGPLPNGPKATPDDSDIKRIQWDKNGKFVQAHFTPGVTTTYVYDQTGADESGRVLQSTVDDGHRRVQTMFVYATQPNINIKPVKIQRTAWLVKDGLPIESSKLVVVTLEATYDDKGQLIKLIGADGVTKILKPTRFAVPLANDSSRQYFQDEPPATSFISQYGAVGSAAENTALKLEANNRSAERRVDDFGRVVAIKNPDQRWQFASYDNADRLTQMQDSRGALQVAQYDAKGSLTELKRYMGNFLEQTVIVLWSGDRKRSEIVRDAQGQALHQTQYTYNALGSQTSQEAKIQTSSQASPVTLATTSTYDAAGRLTSKTLPSGRRIAYRHYANEAHQGQLATIEEINWSKKLDPLILSVASYVKESWLPKTVLATFEPRLETTDSSSGLSVETVHAESPQALPNLSESAPGEDFDDAAFPQTIMSKNGLKQLHWNAAGQLQSIKGKDGIEAQYSYDAQGRRASKRTASDTTYFMYEGTQLIATMSDKKAVRSEYVYAGYKPVAWLYGDQSYEIQTDSRGAVTAVSDTTTKALLWQSQINIWGLVANDPTNTLDPKLRLVNQYYDEETGFHYNVGRYYDPRAGRFISPDPLGVADSLDSETPDILKLDMTAYVSGQPDKFFDPEGAAKIRYFALTTGTNGGALGNPSQGYTLARWAFVINDIRPFGTPTGTEPQQNLQRLQNQYASNQSAILFDKGGNFIGGANDPLAGTTNTTRTTIKWDGTSTGDTVKTAFEQHYGAVAISAPNFYIDIDDANATKLIQFLMSDPAARKSCLETAPGWLPPITFAQGDAMISPASARQENLVADATVQRIVNCNINTISTLPVRYADTLERDRVERIEAAAESVEVGAINKDCSTNGCPGINISGQSGRIYHASYGRSQFVADTFVATLLSMSRSDQVAVGVTDDLLQRLRDGSARSLAVGRTVSSGNAPLGWFTRVRGATNCGSAGNYWDNSGEPGAMAVNDKQSFTTQTLLDRQTFIDMVCFVPDNAGRTTGEGRNAFMTESIFMDPLLKVWLMSLYRSVDRFNFVSRTFIRNNLREVLSTPTLREQLTNYQPQLLAGGSPNLDFINEQRRIEQNLAMRVARLHNGGKQLAVSPNIATLLATDPGGLELVKKVESLSL